MAEDESSSDTRQNHTPRRGRGGGLAYMTIHPRPAQAPTQPVSTPVADNDQEEHQYTDPEASEESEASAQLQAYNHIKAIGGLVGMKWKTTAKPRMKQGVKRRRSPSPTKPVGTETEDSKRPKRHAKPGRFDAILDPDTLKRLPLRPGHFDIFNSLISSTQPLGGSPQGDIPQSSNRKDVNVNPIGSGLGTYLDPLQSVYGIQPDQSNPCPPQLDFAIVAGIHHVGLVIEQFETEPLKTIEANDLNKIIPLLNHQVGKLTSGDVLGHQIFSALNAANLGDMKVLRPYISRSQLTAYRTLFHQLNKLLKRSNFHHERFRQLGDWKTNHQLLDEYKVAGCAEDFTRCTSTLIKNFDLYAPTAQQKVNDSLTSSTTVNISSHIDDISYVRLLAMSLQQAYPTSLTLALWVSSSPEEARKFGQHFANTAKTCIGEFEARIKEKLQVFKDSCIEHWMNDPFVTDSRLYTEEMNKIIRVCVSITCYDFDNEADQIRMGRSGRLSENELPKKNASTQDVQVDETPVRPSAPLPPAGSFNAVMTDLANDGAENVALPLEGDDEQL